VIVSIRPSNFGASVLLESAMIVVSPRSAWNDCRYHMAEKSPAVQPIRHLKVLTPARRHTAEDPQKWRDDNGNVDATLLGHSVLTLLPLHAHRL
jgi:hypothetical protein